MSSIWTSDDITFCTSDCDDMKCERNSKHIHHREIPHSYADLDGDKRFCRKVQDDEKEYQPGVWYDMDTKPIEGKDYLLEAVCVKDNHKCFVVGKYEGEIMWLACNKDDDCYLCNHWMLIPEPPKE